MTQGLTAQGWMAPQPVRRVVRATDSQLRPPTWPASLAPVSQVLSEGLDLHRATILVGENGTGKSTLVEAIALAYGLAPEGGSTGAQHTTRRTESELATHLTLQRGAGASRWGYFLRAETLYGLFTYLEDNPASPAAGEPEFHRLSHGESFLEILGSRRFAGGGFFVMDEPEAGLSFTAQLALLDSLRSVLAHEGAQVLLATHSPILAGLPGAQLLELDEHGIHSRRWDDLDIVAHYRRFLDSPERYLRHLID